MVYVLGGLLSPSSSMRFFEKILETISTGGHMPTMTLLVDLGSVVTGKSEIVSILFGAWTV
jgi:hypothetical protein